MLHISYCIFIVSGDIETNPGPKHSFSSQDLQICHLSILSSYEYKKVSLLLTLLSDHILEIISLSGIYPKSEKLPNNDKLGNTWLQYY